MQCDNRKAQIEITSIMFMHIIGIIGVLTFTFLFISLIAGSQSRAEALHQESLYYNYGRRLISSQDCFAHNHVETHYDGLNFQSFSRTKPGVIDVSKLFTYSNQNCLRYDLVSGAIWQSPDVPYASFPILIYEVTVKDLVNNKIYNFTNDAYNVSGKANIHTICKKDRCYDNCVVDCNEFREYKEDPSGFDVDDSTLSCKSETYLDSEDVEPGSTCWTEEFNNIARMVEPYEEEPELNCSIPSGFDGHEVEYGNVFQRSLQYSVVLKYPKQGTVKAEENPGVFNVRFCVVKIPNYCDPFYSYTHLGFFKKNIHEPSVCKELGLPLV